MSYLIGLTVGLAILGLMLGWWYYRTQPAVKARLPAYSIASSAMAGKSSYYERRLRPLARRLAPRLRGLRPILQPMDVDGALVYAAYPAGLSGAEEVLGLQAILGLGLFVLLFPFCLSGEVGVMALTAIVVLMGLYGPLVWLSGRAGGRQRRITLAVPDFLDLLSICVQAGLGFDGAMENILRHMSGPLADEMRLFTNELRIGVPREECFGRLRARTTSEELHALIDALVQAQELGVPIAKTLEEQSDAMRVHRLQRAREEGAQASPKISLITTILVAPAILCLFLSVVIFYIVGQITSAFGGG